MAASTAFAAMALMVQENPFSAAHTQAWHPPSPPTSDFVNSFDHDLRQAFPARTVRAAATTPSWSLWMVTLFLR
jgi:hypothetical protein